MPARLHIALFGTCRLVYDGTPLTTVDTARLQALLSYLVLHHGTPLPRAPLAFAFWPDSSEKQALTNLRHVLHALRHALPDADRFIRADKKTLTWRHDAPFTLDVAAFEVALASAETALQRVDSDAARAAYERAVRLYEGDLLPGCYDAWIEPLRERLRQGMTLALERLIGLLEDRRDYAAALHFAHRLRVHEPARETAYRTLMRLYALGNDPARALQVYEECERALREELDVAPGPATRDLYTNLLNRRVLPAPPADEPRPELPLVGRHAEWEYLKAAWRRALDGHAFLAVVTGEAGIGKSRLIEELLVWARRQGIATARTRSYAAEGRLAYAPVADWLRAPALRPHLDRLDPVWMAEVVRILPERAGAPPALPEPEPETESLQRRRLFEALARAVLAGNTPLLLLLDDLQWTDRETLEWLRYLLRFAPNAPLLIAGTLRAEETEPDHPVQRLLPDLRRDEQLAEIPLRPVSAEDTARIAAHVSGRAPEAAEAAQLYEETEGNPLFVVESVRASLFKGSLGPGAPAAPGRSEAGALPPRVQAVITERLAGLTPGTREVAAVAATIGRAFSFDVLAHAADAGEADLTAALDELWQRRIVQEQGTRPEGLAYDFTHDKLREVAYASIPPARRRLLHRRVAVALETLHGNDLDAVSAPLAGHYEQAGLPEDAIRCYHRAAEAARRVYANAEAIRLLRRALALLADLPPSTGRDARERTLQTALGACLVMSEGYPSPGVRVAYERARLLSDHLGLLPDAPILRGLALTHITGGDLLEAHALGEALLQRARETDDPVLVVEGHYVLGVTSFWLGRFAASRDHLEQAIRLYDPLHHGTHVAQYVQDPKVVCTCRLGWTLWCLGYPDRARALIAESLTLARALNHPHTLAYVLFYAGQLAVKMRDLPQARQHLPALIALTDEHNFSMWRSMAQMVQAWVQVEQGEIEAGIETLQRMMHTYSLMGNTLGLPQYLGWHADAMTRKGAFEEGQSTLTKAMVLVELRTERYFEAELLRIKGNLLLARGSTDEAEACFRRALDVARHQEARSLELRAAMSLGRLWHDRGKTEQARTLLRPLYEGFEEGFDTPDLKAAHTLLTAWS